jgi:polar amino acid transport system substrate-binding protein
MSRFLLKGFSKNHPSSQLGSIRKISVLLILATGFIVLVAVVAGFALERIKTKIQSDAGEALQIVLQTTQESLNLWVESNKFHVRQLANDPRLISLVERQLKVPRNRDALSSSGALQGLRNFFWHRKDQFGQAGIFFVISPDLVNIASMRDDHIASKNLIANQALDHLNRVFRGAAVLVPPIWSDDPLSSVSAGKRKNWPTMFIVAPVKNIQGKIIAAIARQIDPAGEFTRLIQLGRLGKSGETYAFDEYGKLLSESRFEADLRNTGLLAKDKTSILLVSLRDPGGDMTKGYVPAVPRYQQPLTLMAQAATQGQAGRNVTGYRDYRGVPAYGAWLWDDRLGVGLATEIDEADALSPYYATRTVILTVLAITVFLALGSLVFAVVIEKRASRALQKSHDELEFRVEERTAQLKENQARLEQAEERSRLLLESAKEGIFGVAEDGLVNFINPAGLAMLGFEAKELVGQQIHPLIHHTRPDGTPYPLEECPMHHSLTQGVIGSRDDEVLWRKDSTSFPAEYNSVPIRKNGSIAGTVVIFRDISERKEAEEALKTSRATARGLLDATQESLLLLNKEGTVIAVNQTAARRHQQTPKELIGKNRFDILPENLRKSRKAHFNSVLQTGEPADFEDVRDGMVFHHIYYPVRDKDGAIMGVAIFAQDITERKRAEEAIRESQERLSTILKSTNQGFWLVDNNTVTLDVNDAMCEILGRAKEEIIGRKIYDFLDEENRAKVIKQEEARSESKRSLYEIYLTRADDKQVPCLVNASPLLDGEGDKIGSFGMFTDITERKLAEQAIQESRERLDTILKTTAQGFWLNDPEDNIMEVNEAMCEILNLSKEEVVGKNFFDFLDETNKEVVREQNRIRKKGQQSMYEISLMRPDGKQVPCLMNASPLLDKDGNVIGSFGMTTNIAERKQMEEALRQNVDELERFSKVAYGREKKMIELKQEVNELMLQLGQDAKYKIVK